MTAALIVATATPTAAVLAFAALLGCGVAVLLTHPVLP